MDGLSGSPEAIETVYPHAQVQPCIVHMVRNLLKYVNWKQRKAVADDLKAIYKAATIKEQNWPWRSLHKPGTDNFQRLVASGGNSGSCSPVSLPVRKRFARFYTTNAIESLNSCLRKIIKHRDYFLQTKPRQSCSIWPCRIFPRNGLCRSKTGRPRSISLLFCLRIVYLYHND